MLSKKRSSLASLFALHLCKGLYPAQFEENEEEISSVEKCWLREGLLELNMFGLFVGLTSMKPIVHEGSPKMGRENMSSLKPQTRLVGGLTPLKNMSQWEGLSHILWKIKKCLKPPTNKLINMVYAATGKFW